MHGPFFHLFDIKALFDEAVAFLGAIGKVTHDQVSLSTVLPFIFYFFEENEMIKRC